MTTTEFSFPLSEIQEKLLAKINQAVALAIISKKEAFKAAVEVRERGTLSTGFEKHIAGDLSNFSGTSNS